MTKDRISDPRAAFVSREAERRNAGLLEATLDRLSNFSFGKIFAERDSHLWRTPIRLAKTLRYSATVVTNLVNLVGRSKRSILFLIDCQ